MPSPPPGLPTLKYRRMGNQVTQVITTNGDAVSCICSHTNFFLVGTHQGAVHLLDVDGEKIISTINNHSVTVTCVSVDISGEYIASGSDDGKVFINSTHRLTEKLSYQFQSPVKSVAIDPNYKLKDSRRVVVGTKDGELRMNSKSFFSHKSVLLHKGEGTVHSIAWSGNLITWANTTGVKIFDLELHDRISFIPRPTLDSDRIPYQMFPCSLHWESPSSLIVGWIDNIMIVEIKTRTAAEMQGPNGTVLPLRYGVITHSFTNEFYISGVVPFGKNLIILSYYEAGDDEGSYDEESTSTAPTDSSSSTSTKPKFRIADQPELCIVSREGETIDEENLPLEHFCEFYPNNFTLCKLTQSDKFYISSPRDIILAKKCDADDYVGWYFQRKKYFESLSYARKHTSILQSHHRIINIGEKCVEQLLKSSQPEIASSILGYILGGSIIQLCDSSDEVGSTLELPDTELTPSSFPLLPNPVISNLNTFMDSEIPLKSKIVLRPSLDPSLDQNEISLKWEFWIFQVFQELGCLPVLVPYLPVENPTLDSSIYTRVLQECLDTGNITLFLFYIKIWKKSMFIIDDLIPNIISKLKQEENPLLMIGLSLLYMYQNRYPEALSIYLTLRRGPIFKLIRSKNIHSSVQDPNRILLLFTLDAEETLSLVSEFPSFWPIHSMVQLLKIASQKQPFFEEILCKYLRKMFRINHEVTAPFNNIQVELYARHDPDFLLFFLRVAKFDSPSSLKNALKLCSELDLYEAQTFILKRLGSFDQALQIFIEKMNNVDLAVRFCAEIQNDALWERLIQMCLLHTDLFSQLLDKLVELDTVRVDMVSILKSVPPVMPDGGQISGLREKLLKFLENAKLQLRLYHECRECMKEDILSLLYRLYSQNRRGVFVAIKSNIPHVVGSETVPCPVLSATWSAENMVYEPVPTPLAKDCVVVSFSRHLFPANTADIENPNFEAKLTQWIKKLEGGGRSKR